MLGLAALIVTLALWALTVGATPISLGQILAILRDTSADSHEGLILWSVRLPRVVAAVVVGASLAVAGAIMQAVTGNPLAEPGLLGVNAGAAFAVVVLTVVLGPGVAMGLTLWAAYGGAASAAVLVYALRAKGPMGATP